MTPVTDEKDATCYHCGHPRYEHGDTSGACYVQYGRLVWCGCVQFYVRVASIRAVLVDWR